MELRLNDLLLEILTEIIKTMENYDKTIDIGVFEDGDITKIVFFDHQSARDLFNAYNGEYKAMAQSIVDGIDKLTEENVLH